MTPETAIGRAAILRSAETPATATAFQLNIASTHARFPGATFGSNHLDALHALGLAEFNLRIAANVSPILDAHNKMYAPSHGEYKSAYKNWIATRASDDAGSINRQIGVGPKGYGNEPRTGAHCE